MGYERDYPELIPTEAAADLFRIGRGGLDAIRAERRAFALAFWNVWGFAQRQAIGQPKDPPLIGASPTELDDDQAWGYVELMASQVVASPPVVSLGPVPWGLLLKFFVDKVLPLLIKD